MLFKCCKVKNCHNSTARPGTAFKFYQIPMAPERRLQWAEVMCMDLSDFHVHSAVCSDHFDPKHLVWNGTVWKLNRNAFPQKFLNGERRCSVDKCPNVEGEGVHKLYIFPNFKSIAAQWKAFTKRKNFEPSRSSFICSAHFSIHQYNGVHLKWDAVPDVVGFEEEEEENAEGDENVNQTEEVTVNEESAAPTQMDINNKLWVVDSIIEMGTNSVSSHANQKNPSEESSLSYSRISSKIKARQQSTKIRTLQQKVRRQTKQIESMKTLISVLKNRLLHCTCEIVDL